MATYTLDRNETEEHVHSVPTTTTLIEGDAELELDGQRIKLEIGCDFVIPPNVVHKVVNIGQTPVKFGCAC